MVEIAKSARSFSLVAPASINAAAKTLRDLGASASPTSTDLRQQANDMRTLGNALIGRASATNEIERARALGESDELSKTIAAAIQSAASRMSAVSSYNNDRENRILRNSSAAAGAGAAMVAFLKETSAEFGDSDLTGILSIVASANTRSNRVTPRDVTASQSRGPKFGEDIFDRGIQPLVGASGGITVTVARRALTDEQIRALTNPDDPTSRGTSMLRAVDGGSARADNEGFIIKANAISANTTAVYDTRDPNEEDERRTSISQDFGSGSDVLFVAGNNDTVADGGAGDDILVAEGNSLLRGGDGDDLLAGQAAFGDDGDDIVFASLYGSGGAGNDVITVFQADPEDPQRLTAVGGDGDDVIIADDAAAAFGDEGDDKILLRRGGAAQGGAGDDTITSFGRAEIDSGDGNDSIRLGAAQLGFQVGGKVIAGAGRDDVEAYGYTDLALGSGTDKAVLATGGVIRFNKGDGADTVELGVVAEPRAGETKKKNTVILGDMMPADVDIEILGSTVTITRKLSSDSLTIELDSIAEPLNLRFETAAFVQVVTVQFGTQTVGAVKVKTGEFNPEFPDM
jgi:hypothetical protein